MGFSAETLTLLGDEAARAQELLRSKGVLQPLYLPLPLFYTELCKGISPEQMKANSQIRRQFIDQWVPLSNLPANEKALLQKAVGGAIHPLVRLMGILLFVFYSI